MPMNKTHRHRRLYSAAITDRARRCYTLRVELERDPGDLDVVAGLEALRLERADHADPPQPALEVRERVLVVEVVAGDQPLDPGAADR